MKYILLFITCLLGVNLVLAKHAEPPKQGKPTFITLGHTSGIEVIGWKNAPHLTPDAPLTTLLQRGAKAFENALVQKLKLNTSVSDDHLSARISNPDYLLQLSRYEIARVIGPESIGQILTRREGKDFLARFFSSQDWMDDFLVAGVLNPKNAAANLHALCSLYRYDKESTIPLYRKLACAYARSTSGDWQTGPFHHHLLDRYQAQKKAHKSGRMHASFDHLETWEMLSVIANNRMGDSRDIAYMVNHVNYPRGKYYGACWTIAYRRTSPLGDSIHARHYYTPWANRYFEVAQRHKVGGVCGTLSNYGAGLARAHGVPSFAVGQPGHCAYMLRSTDQNWGTAYSVTGNTSAGSLFGGGDESIVRLMQAAYDNRKRPQLLLAYHYNWLANAYHTQKNPKAEGAARQLGLKACPLHLNHWKAYAAYLAKSSTTNTTTWINFSNHLIAALHDWQRPCWETLTSTVLPHLTKINAKERIKLIASWHRSMKETPNTQFIGGRLKDHINAQTKPLEKPQDKAAVLKVLLVQYAGTRYLPTVIDWGRGALTSTPESSKLFLKELASFAKNAPGETKGFERILGKIILDAEKRNDAETFISTSRLAHQLFKDQVPKFSHFPHAKPLTNIPEAKVEFRSKLLSANAIPVLAHAYDDYTPLAHALALQPKQIGFLITRKQANPTITLKLPGKCEINAISLIPRFENEDSIKKILPLIISTSSDGKTWNKVYETSEVQKIYDIDLSKSHPKATQIRFERADKNRVDYFALRSIKVYGNTRY